MKHLTAVAVLVLSIVSMNTIGSDAAVPGKGFTETGCDEYSDSVARLYTAGLGREPEQGGFEFWMTEYTAGRWQLPAMATFFTQSPEFEQSYGTLSQDGFIRQLYRNVLGREGEQGGVAFWNEQMDAGMDRGTVLLRFSESPENITNSGTVEPILGPFNAGLTEAWSCPTWTPGQTPDPQPGDGQDLRDEVFTEADLSGADLRYANMADALVFDSNFSGADLTGAILTDLVIQRSDFSGVNFTDANLSDALIAGSVDLTGAIWNNTTCPDESNSDDNGGTCILA